MSYENVPLVRQYLVKPLNKFYFSVFPLLSFSSLNTSTVPKFPSIQQSLISYIFSMFVIIRASMSAALCLQSLNTVHVIISSPDHLLPYRFHCVLSFLHSALTACLAFCSQFQLSYVPANTRDHSDRLPAHTGRGLCKVGLIFRLAVSEICYSFG